MTSPVQRLARTAAMVVPFLLVSQATAQQDASAQSARTPEAAPSADRAAPELTVQASEPDAPRDDSPSTEAADDLDDSEWADKPKPRTRLNSVGAMVTGIVLSGVGAMSALSGLVYMAIPDTACSTPEDPYATCPTDTLRSTGQVLLIAGGLMVAVGIPLIVVGAKRVPVESTGWMAPPVFTASIRVGPGALGINGTW
jgi:hypothetical protein